MSNNLDILEGLIEKISSSTGLDEQQIAVKMGYSKGYIAQVRSRAKNQDTQVPDKIINALKLQLAMSSNGIAEVSTLETSYIEKRRKRKAESDEDQDGIEFVPIAAQAGYLKNLVDPSTTPMKLEKIFIPGFPFRGPNYRYFEVAGDSMTPSLEEGFHVLAERCEPEYWHQQANFYIYVIVTDDQIMIKRVFWKSEEEWVIISDNEEFYPQFTLPVQRVKELWKVKRKIDWKMSPARKFEIKV